MKESTYVEIDQEQFTIFMQLPKETPVVMLNLLKFNKRIPETGVSGEASYKAYMKQARPFFEKAKAEVLFLGKPQATLIGPKDEVLWDKVLLIKYHSIADFLRMVKAEGYPSGLRAQSLSDSRLIYCSDGY